jgi:hypothetical protein
MNQQYILNAINRLEELGVDTRTLHEDYYKIPLETTTFENTEIKKKRLVSKHNIVIDSRTRNYQIYPNANKYSIDLMEPHRNVERIELIAAMLPKTEYNVSSENNLILLTISGVTEALYLAEGQYLIGTNVLGESYIANGTPVISGLLAEVKKTLNRHSLSDDAFNVFLATCPPANNASVNNRIVITNSSKSFSLDFRNGVYSSGSPYRLLGFQKGKINSNGYSQIYGTDNLGTCTPTDIQNENIHTITIQSVVSVFDYDLIDDPMYIIMDIEFGNKSADRIESIDKSSNQKFAVVIYDSNDPDNLESYATNQVNTRAGFIRRPGRLKALKGADFDKKIITFDPPFTLENFKITFYKYDNTLYNFHNREHVLTFEIDVVDYDPNYKY